MTKLYLSGAISNNPDYKRDFAAAKAKLIAAGYDVINPVEDIGNNEEKSWQENIINCLHVIADGHFNGIAVIADCVDCLVSTGANIEILFARKMGIPVKTVDYWLKLAGERAK